MAVYCHQDVLLAAFCRYLILSDFILSYDTCCVTRQTTSHAIHLYSYRHAIVTLYLFWIQLKTRQDRQWHFKNRFSNPRLTLINTEILIFHTFRRNDYDSVATLDNQNDSLFHCLNTLWYHTSICQALCSRLDILKI